MENSWTAIEDLLQEQPPEIRNRITSTLTEYPPLMCPKCECKRVRYRFDCGIQDNTHYKCVGCPDIDDDIIWTA